MREAVGDKPAPFVEAFDSGCGFVLVELCDVSAVGLGSKVAAAAFLAGAPVHKHAASPGTQQQNVVILDGIGQAGPDNVNFGSKPDAYPSLIINGAMLQSAEC